MALTKEGYRRETYEDILNRMETKAREVFGDNVNTATRVVVGMILRVVAFALSYLHQDIEDVYHSNDRNKAEGEALDVHAANNGTVRETASQAWGYVSVFIDSEEDVRIPAGTIFVSVDDVQYYSTEDTLITKEQEFAVLQIIAVESGTSGNANTEEITRLLNPIAHVVEVVNYEAITNGEDIENDTALRRRLDLLIKGMGGSTVSAIEAHLLKVPGVRSVFVDENYGDTMTVYGTPVSAFQAFVTGGQETDIARAILDVKAAGIEPFGEITVQTQDTNGRWKDIGFSRAATEPVLVNVQVVTDETFTVDGPRQINDIVYSAIGGYDAVNGVQHDNVLGMGGRIVASHIMSAIMGVQGVTDLELTLFVNGRSYVNRNVDIYEYYIADVTACDVLVVDELV